MLGKLVELKLRAQTSIDQITSYRDKAKAFQVHEFMDITDEAYKVLLPLQENDFDR
jgi:hypothetical protein